MDGKCGNIPRMEQTFQTMKEADIVTFTSMAKAYVINVGARSLPSFAERVFAFRTFR